MQAVAVGREGVDRAGAAPAVGAGVLGPGRCPARRSSGARRRARGRAPHGNGSPTSPPRAACSHSASVGSRPPHHAAYASASRRDTWTTGWSARSATEECGPSGWAQSAPCTSRHHGAAATPRVGAKSSGRKPPNTNDQPNSSASVRCPVAATNAANSALLTAQRAIRYGATSTSRTGHSSGWSGSSLPSWVIPPASATSPVAVVSTPGRGRPRTSTIEGVAPRDGEQQPLTGGRSPPARARCRNPRRRPRRGRSAPGGSAPRSGCAPAGSRRRPASRGRRRR